jgi:hypothetical protein
VKGLALFLPALILVPFLLLKPNRRVGAWLMLIPFVLVAAAAWVGLLMRLNWLLRYFSMANSYFSYAGLIIPSLRAGSIGEPFLNVMMLASGLCVLFLMTHALPARSRIKRFVAALVLFVLPGALALFFFQRGDEGRLWGAPLAYAFVPLALLVSLMVAGRLSRKHWNPVLFTVLVFILNIVMLYALRILYFGSLMIRQPTVRPQWWSFLMPRMSSVWPGPTVLFIVTFLFILAAFMIPLFRERLKAAFKVMPAPQAEQPADGGTSAS